MTTAKLQGSRFLAVAAVLSCLATAGAAAAQEAPLGPAVDGRVEPATVASESDDDDDDDAQVGRPPRSKRTNDRIRGGAGLGVMGVFDDAGSGTLVQVEGRFGAQLNALFGIYAQLGLAGGDLDQRGGGEGRAAYATLAIIPEFHILDELAIGLGPVVMAGQRDADQAGPRIRHGRSPLDGIGRDRSDGREDDEMVDRYGLMLRVSPAIGEVKRSGRIHAFRPSFEIAVLATDRDVIEPEQHVMVLAGVSLGWDTW